MAKTISQSITSIETSETSLESSLSKCKTSISNKGVSVPSTTRFSNLPALIDKIDIDPIKITVSHPYADGYMDKVQVELYEDNVLKQQYRLQAGNCHTFTISDKSASCRLDYVAGFANKAIPRLSFSVWEGAVLNPVYYIIVADDISRITKAILYDFAGNNKGDTFTMEDGFLYVQRYSADGDRLRVEYKDDNNRHAYDSLVLHTYDYQHVHIVVINFENSTYSEHIMSSNFFKTVETNSRF